MKYKVFKMCNFGKQNVKNKILQVHRLNYLSVNSILKPRNPPGIYRTACRSQCIGHIHHFICLWNIFWQTEIYFFHIRGMTGKIQSLILYILWQIFSGLFFSKYSNSLLLGEVYAVVNSLKILQKVCGTIFVCCFTPCVERDLKRQ